jgi:hypothetical protein
MLYNPIFIPGIGQTPVGWTAGTVFTLAKIIYSLFNHDNRIKLTQANWNNIVPFQAPLYNDIRAYLKSTIVYDVDLKENVPYFTLQYLRSAGYTNLQQAIKRLEYERNYSYIPVNISFKVHSQFQGTAEEKEFLDNFYNIFYGTQSDFLKNPNLWILGGLVILIIFIWIKK